MSRYYVCILGIQNLIIIVAIIIIIIIIASEEATEFKRKYMICLVPIFLGQVNTGKT